MKYQLNHHRWLLSVSAVSLFLLVVGLQSCGNNDPEPEQVPETITDVTLRFTPSGGGTAVTATASDPDNDGPQDIVVSGPVGLTKGVTYVLTIELLNKLATPGEDGYDISEEVEAEGDDHQFFFSWTSDAFSNPAGNGNIDTAADPVNYTGASNSKDSKGQNLGLTTTWTTAATAVSGSSFRVLLKHQPELKTATSGSTIGETDLDVTFTLNVN